MKIVKTAVCGTMESSDIMVTLSPNDGKGIEIELDSTVEKQFGRAIRAAIVETLTELGIQDANVRAVDKGALDCVVRARTKTGAYRACERDDYV